MSLAVYYNGSHAFHSSLPTALTLPLPVPAPGGKECILYGTVMGAVGAFLPFASREDVDFFSHLEMHLRQEQPPLCGRDHMAYRSAYFPVKVPRMLTRMHPDLSVMSPGTIWALKPRVDFPRLWREQCRAKDNRVATK